MTEKEIKQIIRQLKTYKLSIDDVPEEVAFDKEIIRAERKYRLRRTKNRGFDVINQNFFVEEEIFYKDSFEGMDSKSIKTVFDTLEEFYDFLEGDIYTDACYRYYDFEKDNAFIKKNKIDVEKLKERKAFITQTIDDFSLEISKEELDKFEKGEKTKELCKDWIKKFDECKCYEDFSQIVTNYKNSQIEKAVDISFFFFNYIFKDVKDMDRFAVVMEYMSTGKYPAWKVIKPLCLIYDPDKVVANYNYSLGTKRTISNYKRRLKSYASNVKNGEIEFYTHAFFDRTTHFYCEETWGYYDKVLEKYQRYFETFEEFIEYRKGDLRGCDLSKAINLEVDFSQYDMDESTKLPFTNKDKLVYTVKKEFWRGDFYVEKQWKNTNGCLIKSKNFSTPYFFDFVYYLNNDLSNADLLLCDGLKNLTSTEGINFDGALMTSTMCEKFGVKYELYELNEDVIASFEILEKNEETAILSIKTEKNSCDVINSGMHNLMLTSNWDKNSKKVYYITDIHLMHRLKDAKCKSKTDVLYVIRNIVENIAREADGLLLIGGDVSSEFEIFKLFVKVLKKYVNKEVVFILGNHELWEFPNKSIDEIAEMYREFIEENGMFFIQNDLLYKDSSNQFCKITYEQLLKCDHKKLREQMQRTRLVIFGGLGFSGYNEEFNANNGIYRATLNRTGEIEETEKFEKLYNTVVPSIYDKNVIVFTHTPKNDWCKEKEMQQNFIYVSGHTHRNVFYDDGDYRIYSDNQIGYHNENVHLKNFIMDNEYDCFSDYDDGIYEFSGAQYNDFYRGKNIKMTFTREINILYMLKKKGYYCFIHKAKSGSLTILNGGALKKLDEKDVRYYYDHMDEVISYIRKPLDKYMSIQQCVSKEIQKIGGRGTIHGCIIDIDWENHIYINPVDMSITGYWALDVINKVVYPDIPSLLKVECPVLYANYLKLIEGDQKNPLVPRRKENVEVELLPQGYLSTDIYQVSREIKKMQKLTSNILCSWNEKPMEGNEILVDSKGN